MRLIDADELRHKAEHCIETTDMFIEMIDEQPIVDAVEVIRCKDCKWSYWQDETDWSYEGLYCHQYGASMNDDDFCSRGERR